MSAQPDFTVPGVLHRVSACAGMILAPNPGPMTLDSGMHGPGHPLSRVRLP